jgi:uncharacterized RDD family membrane protein YckC
VYVPIWEEDRKPLDSRRVLAVLLDGVVVAPVLIPLALIFGSVNRSAWLIYLACALTYFHVMETRTGQTLGKRALDLRVVSKTDAGPATAKAISIRTVLRLVDGFPVAYVVGGITMLATGKRRQRLGDLAAGTVVTRASARPYTAARRSPLVTIYPALWIGAALILAVWIARADDRFLGKVDRLCKQADKASSDLGPSKPLDRQLAIRIDLERRIAMLRVADDETRKKRFRILQILDSDARLAYNLLQDYRATGSQEQFRNGATALISSSEAHSAQLDREFGLGNC